MTLIGVCGSTDTFSAKGAQGYGRGSRFAIEFSGPTNTPTDEQVFEFSPPIFSGHDGASGPDWSPDHRTAWFRVTKPTGVVPEIGVATVIVNGPIEDDHGRTSAVPPGTKSPVLSGEYFTSQGKLFPCIRVCAITCACFMPQRSAERARSTIIKNAKPVMLVHTRTSWHT